MESFLPENVRLTEDVAQMLVYLANEQGISVEEALRRAVGTEIYFQKKRRDKAKVLVMEGQDIREVTFR